MSDSCDKWKKQEVFAMIAILGSFLQYLIVMILLAAIGIAGAIVGKKMRERKDAKDAALTAEEKQ